MYQFHLPPTLLATFSLIAGIIYAYFGYPWIYAISSCVFIYIVVGSYVFYTKRVSTHYAISGIIISFFILGSWRYTAQQTYHAHLLDAMQDKTIDVICTIDDINSTALPRQLQYTIQITSWKPIESQEWKPCNVKAYIYGSRNANLEVADQISIENVLLKPPRNNAYKQYLIKEGISCSIFKSLKDYTLIHKPHYSVNRWLWNVRHTVIQRIGLKMNRVTASLFSSIFLGNTKRYFHESSDWSNLFRTWGISHYLARSGIHVTLFISLWFIILRSIPITLIIKQLILFLLLCCYAAMSWPSISFHRALHSALLLVWSRVHKRNTHFLHILATVCLITLIYNPICLLFLDFELSYGLTFALGWFNYLNK